MKLPATNIAKHVILQYEIWSYISTPLKGDPSISNRYSVTLSSTTAGLNFIQAKVLAAWWSVATRLILKHEIQS